MMKIVKSILFLLFVVAWHVTVDNTFTKEENSEGMDIALQHTSLPYRLDNVRWPLLPDAELGSTGLPYSQTASSRIQRIQSGEQTFYLRSISQIMAEHKAMLFSHWMRVADSSDLLSIIYPACEYYVFALRRIVI